MNNYISLTEQQHQIVWLIIACLALLFFVLYLGYKFEKKRHQTGWQFKKNLNYSIIEQCKHPYTITRVLESSATCEVTVEVCADCDYPVSEPKMDCR